jgi:prenyltransferase beta subunit
MPRSTASKSKRNHQRKKGRFMLTEHEYFNRDHIPKRSLKLLDKNRGNYEIRRYLKSTELKLSLWKNKAKNPVSTKVVYKRKSLKEEGNICIIFLYSHTISQTYKTLLSLWNLRKESPCGAEKRI